MQSGSIRAERQRRSSAGQSHNTGKLEQSFSQNRGKATVTPRINSIEKAMGEIRYEELAQAAAQSEPLSKPPKTLKLQEIDVAETGVFQWRMDNENVFQ